MDLFRKKEVASLQSLVLEAKMAQLASVQEVQMLNLQQSVLEKELAKSNSTQRALLRILKERNQEIKELRTPPPRPGFSKEPLYYSEAQEDVIYAQGAEVIDIDVAQDLLRALDFENTQVYLDDSIE